MKYNKDDIASLDQRKRVLFINSLSGFKSANLVGSIDQNGNSNLAIVSSVVHLGANPPLLGMVMRPHTVPRGTLENILSTEVYTLNHVNSDIYEKAHQTSARYPDDVSEFAEVGLNEEWLENFKAPFVKESIIKLGMKFREKHSLDINGTEFVIGEIISVDLPDDLIGDDGFVALEKAKTVTVSSLDTYHSTQTLKSLSYAKPEKALTELRKNNVSSSILNKIEAQATSLKSVLVVAANGGIGQAFCQNILALHPNVQLIRMARDIANLPSLTGNILDIELDLVNDESIENAISFLPENISVDWVFVASGWLHNDAMKPEKTYRSLDREQLLHSYNINAVGPALFISRLLSIVEKNHPMKIGILSARVGSVSDNRLGGWHSYRSSKSALHMLIKNISIECASKKSPITIVGLQPGTTDTQLSAPFQKGLSPKQLQTPDFTAQHLIKVMDAIEIEDSGKLFDFEGLCFEP